MYLINIYILLYTSNQDLNLFKKWTELYSLILKLRMFWTTYLLWFKIFAYMDLIIYKSLKIGFNFELHPEIGYKTHSMT